MLLKELLKTKGVKQNWLASRLGVSEVTVSNWVKEKSIPSQKHLEKLTVRIWSGGFSNISWG